MKALNAAALAHILRHTQTLAVCWRIERQDGELILGTEHDRDIALETGISPDDYGGLYLSRAGISGSDIRSSSDLSVDNLEVQGSTQRDLTVTDIRAVDIEAGLLDNASVRIFLVNWKLPEAFQIVIKSGTIGDIMRTAEGRYRTEMRGVSQQLAKNFIRTYSILCDAELYDERCKVDRASHTYSGSVTAVTNRKTFTVSITSPPTDERIVRGEITFTSGENTGFSKEVKSYAAGSMGLYEPMPLDVEVGDTFEVTEGCDKTRPTCKDVFNNLLNRRAHGDFVPGQNEVLKVGGQERLDS
jgi:uncharacterized phage protein (TIGR02218 family)